MIVLEVDPSRCRRFIAQLESVLIDRDTVTQSGANQNLLAKIIKPTVDELDKLSPYHNKSDSLRSIWLKSSSPTNTLSIISNLCNHEPFVRHMNRIYVVNDTPVSTESELVTAIVAFVDAAVVSVRLQTRSESKVHQSIGERLSKLGVKFDPKAFTHVLSIINNTVDGSFVFGLCEKRVLNPFFSAKLELQDQSSTKNTTESESFQATLLSRKNALCRATFKLKEVLASIPMSSGTRVLDVGAAPGGWTGWLASQSWCKAVCAVDPALLHDSVASNPKVEHLRTKIEDALPVLRQGGNTFDMVVCDMNFDARDAAASIVCCVPLLSKEAKLVLTIKLPQRVGAAQILKHQREVTEVLTSAGFSDIELVHLLANTQWERTVVARFKRSG
eukprot:m.136347 g.136347  ORF g.136347 m.136347 type:complete len:388 (+) comp29843_c0_seq1:197-1360(+)